MKQFMSDSNSLKKNYYWLQFIRFFRGPFIVQMLLIFQPEKLPSSLDLAPLSAGIKWVWAKPVWGLRIILPHFLPAESEFEPSLYGNYGYITGSVSRFENFLAVMCDTPTYRPYRVGTSVVIINNYCRRELLRHCHHTTQLSTQSYFQKIRVVDDIVRMISLWRIQPLTTRLVWDGSIFIYLQAHGPFSSCNVNGQILCRKIG